MLWLEHVMQICVVLHNLKIALFDCLNASPSKALTRHKRAMRVKPAYDYTNMIIIDLVMIFLLFLGSGKSVQQQNEIHNLSSTM